MNNITEICDYATQCKDFEDKIADATNEKIQNLIVELINYAFDQPKAPAAFSTDSVK